MLRGWRVSRAVSAFVRGKSTWNGVKLSNRSVIRLSGEESRDFIQGLITNDIHHLGGTVSNVYTLFLNKAGRVLYDAVIYGTENRGELFVETDGAVAKDLRKHMMIYRIRRKIAIDLVDDEFAVWAAFGGDEKEPLEITNSRPDPRLKDLGFRILCRDDKEVENHLEVTSMSQYNKHRYQLGIPEGVKEIIPGKAFPLEVNCDFMNGLSVHKGCYLGQEFTARTYHTGVIRKRIMPVELEESPPPGEDLIEKDVLLADEKSGGKVKGIEDKSGIGLLRIEKVLASDILRVNKSISLRTWKPSWWPEKTS